MKKNELKNNALRELIEKLTYEKYDLLYECEEIEIQYNKYKSNMFKVNYINTLISTLEFELYNNE